MQQHLQNRLLNHEVEPPRVVWDKISRQLDEEYSAADAPFSSRMMEATITPPASSWSVIAAELDKPEAAPTVIPYRQRPFIFRRMAAAAVVAGAVAIAALFFFNTGKDDASRPVVASSARLASPERSAQPAPRKPIADDDTIAATNSSTASAGSPRPIPRRRFTTTMARTAHVQYAEYEELDIDPKPVPVAALQRIEVDAPLIRDANGKVIMDYSVISDPNDPYIVVTSPSGLQTRISNKFINCVSYLCNRTPSAINDKEAELCKSRFEEWRTKLLDQAAFIPGANNFFDIFELKEMIQE